jgi:hypothetical protein
MASEPNYWLALFSQSTWRTFLENGARVVGFRQTHWPRLQTVESGDYLLAYLTGLSRWIGLLAVTGPAYLDTTPIWSEAPLPARLPVKPAVLLAPETAVPFAELRAQMGLDRDAFWTAPLRRSATCWPRVRGEAIAEALLDAQLHPAVRPVNPRRYPRSLRSLATDAAPSTRRIGEREPGTHTEIQWLLLKLGSDLGLDIWAARNDRSRRYAGQRFADLPGFLDALPRQFDPNTMQVIEHIDVLWLRQGAILAAFEIECTSTVYSGLLRLADLVTMQPNLALPLYIVAPDRRRDKVQREMSRPSFSRLRPPLNQRCRLLRFSHLRVGVQQAQPLLPHLDPEFIRDLSEACDGN